MEIRNRSPIPFGAMVGMVGQPFVGLASVRGPMGPFLLYGLSPAVPTQFGVGLQSAALVAPMVASGAVKA